MENAEMLAVSEVSYISINSFALENCGDENKTEIEKVRTKFPTLPHFGVKLDNDVLPTSLR